MTSPFFVGYEWPETATKRATVYLHGFEFGHVYTIVGWGKPLDGRVSFNRATYAIHLEVPLETASRTHSSIEELIGILEKWYESWRIS